MIQNKYVLYINYYYYKFDIHTHKSITFSLYLSKNFGIHITCSYLDEYEILLLRNTITNYTTPNTTYYPCKNNTG